MAYVSNSQQPAAGVSPVPQTNTARPLGAPTTSQHGQRPAVDPAIAARKALLEQRVAMALRELDVRAYQSFRNAVFSYEQIVKGTQKEREALAALDPKSPTIKKFDRLLKDIDDVLNRFATS
jgi:hypothetical protein